MLLLFPLIPACCSRVRARVRHRRRRRWQLLRLGGADTRTRIRMRTRRGEACARKCHRSDLAGFRCTREGKKREEKKKRQPRPRAKQFISLAIVDMIDSLRTHAPSACACVCTLQSNDTCNSPRRRQLWRLALVLYQACCVACRAVPYGWMSYYVYSSLDVSGLIIPGGGDKRPYAIGSVCSLLYNPSSPSARCCFLGLAAVCWRKRCTLSSAKPCAQIYGPCKWVCLFR